MPKNPRVRKLMDGQHVKGSERLLNLTLQYLCDIFWSLWRKVSWKSSVLVVPEILRLFVNLLTPHGSYSVSVKAGVQRKKLKCSDP